MFDEDITWTRSWWKRPEHQEEISAFLEENEYGHGYEFNDDSYHGVKLKDLPHAVLLERFPGIPGDDDRYRWEKQDREDQRAANKAEQDAKTLGMKELDLTLGEGHHHPDIVPRDKEYLCLIDGRFFAGTFSEVWFGLSFNGWHNHLQYDKPGTNSSSFQRIWEIQHEHDNS